MTEILALMTCYNRKVKTLNSISTLITGNKNINFNFIVVDDNSTDGTAQELSILENVTVLKGSGGLFYSGGMRCAIDFVKKNNLTADYVLFFNDDVDFYNEVISNMISYSENKEEIIVGATENALGELTYGGVLKTSKFKPKFKMLMSDNNKVYCDTFCANCVLIPFNIFKTLDNIDAMYQHSMGDFDYGLMATKNGFKICVTNFFIGLCEDNPISDNWLDNTKSIKERIKLKESVKGLPSKIWFYFIKKHFGLLSAIIFSTTQYIKIIFRL